MSAALFKSDGDAAWRHGRWQDAVSAWSDALTSQEGCPADLKPTLYSNRSAAHLKLNNTQAALRDAESCVRLNPDWAKGHMRLGGARMATGQLSQAYDAFATAAALEPGNREYAAAASDARYQATQQRGPTPPPQAPPHGGGNGNGNGAPAANPLADGVAWCYANQQLIGQGLIALVAVWYLMGGGMELGSVLLLGGAVFAGHRAGMSPFQIMMLVNMLRGHGGGRRRGYGGMGGMGGMGMGGLGGMGRRW